MKATIKLVGYSQVVRGHVGSVASGINVPNAQPDQAGLASVNPIFTWVRLAQRVPVHIHIDQAPKSVRLVAGMTQLSRLILDPICQRRKFDCAKGDNACAHSQGRIDGQPDVAGPIAAHITRKLAESNHILDKRGRRSPFGYPSRSCHSPGMKPAGGWRRKLVSYSG
jgi:hypothetical protein